MGPKKFLNFAKAQDLKLGDSFEEALDVATMLKEQFDEAWKP